MNPINIEICVYVNEVVLTVEKKLKYGIKLEDWNYPEQANNEKYKEIHI